MMFFWVYPRPSDLNKLFDDQEILNYLGFIVRKKNEKERERENLEMT